MITIEFTATSTDFKATLYAVDFAGSFPVREYELTPNKVNQLVLPISEEDWAFEGMDDGCFLVIQFGKRKNMKERYLDKSLCAIVV